MSDNSIYEQMPSDLRELYDWANERYFNGQLPAPKSIEYCRRTTRSAGNMRPFMIHSPFRFSIKLGDVCVSNPKERLNTLVHEMVHIWQVYKATTENNPAYLDKESPGRKEPAGFTRGHKHHFNKMADEINRRFTEVHVTTSLNVWDIGAEDELVSPVRGFFVTAANVWGRPMTGGYYFARDDGSLSGALMDDICARHVNMGEISVVPFETRAPIAQMLTRLTLKNTLPRRTSEPVFHTKKALDGIRNHPSTALGEPLVRTRTAVKAAAASAMPEILTSIFDEYEGYLELDMLSALECGIEHAKQHHAHTMPGAIELLGGAHPQIWPPRATQELFDRWRSIDCPFDVFKAAPHQTRLQRIAQKLAQKDSAAAQRHLTRLLAESGISRFPNPLSVKRAAFMCQYSSKALPGAKPVRPMELRAQLDQLSFNEIKTMTPLQIANTLGIDLALKREEFTGRMVAASYQCRGSADVGEIERLWQISATDGQALVRQASLGPLVQCLSRYLGGPGDDRLSALEASSWHAPFASRIGQAQFYRIITDAFEQMVLSEVRTRLEDKEINKTAARMRGAAKMFLKDATDPRCSQMELF